MPIRVRYAETDAHGVVYHANYLIYMEVARGVFAREKGLPYEQVEAQGVKLVVISAGLSYRKPARYGDEVVVRLRVAELRDKTVTFKYRIERTGTGDLLVRAETTHICTDMDMRPVPFPGWLRELLEERG